MIGIVDYGLGNLRSVAGAIEKLEFDSVISSDPAVLEDAEKLVLPGVGAFGDGMANLKARGLISALNDLVISGNVPILGICLGAQLMAVGGEEFGSHEGLGWLDAQVIKLTPNDTDLRIPHVGWDELIVKQACPLLDGIPDDALFYYVHSYCILANDPGIVVGECDYGQRFASVLRSKNIFATQFHPEKSQKHGLEMLNNFLSRC